MINKKRIKITRTSMLSDITRSMFLDITQEQIDAYNKGALVQHAFPNLSADEREFIITGITSAEWDEAFAEEEDE